MNTPAKSTTIEPVTEQNFAHQNDLGDQYDLADQVVKLTEENAAVKQQNVELAAKLRWYEEQYLLSKHKLHGASSEHTPEQQAMVFNELEVAVDQQDQEPATETVSYERKRTKGHKEAQLEGLPIEVINYELPEAEQVCSCCNGALHRMSEEVRTELKIVPAALSVVKHVRGVYSCRQCERSEITTPIVTAPAPSPAFPNSLASPSSVAFVMDQKFTLGIPLYRLEQSFIRLGLGLSRQTMANWMLKGAGLLNPVYERLQDHLLKRDILHADETTLQVLHEEGRKAQTTSYMWLYRSGRDGPPIVLFDYQATRAGAHPKDILQDFSGYLHVDGYAGYNNIPNVTLVGCWAHARRNFFDALAALPASARRKGSPTLAEQGLIFCNKLFEIERTATDSTADQRLQKRKERSMPLLEEFKAWLEKSSSLAAPKSGPGKAIDYCLNQWSKLTAFLMDGRLELDNNRSERSIKPFVIGRKNWLFANTPRGATASATIYSIVETAKENGLMPLEYLTFLFEKLPSIDSDDPAAVDQLMPWSDTLPAFCRFRKP